MATPPPSLMRTVLDGPLPSFASLPARFKCVVCHDVLKDPWQTECGHRMCVSCMTGMFQTATPQVMCPANDDDCEIISRDRMFYDRGMCREILSQHVYCSYKNAGCISLMKWSELHSHVEKCEFVTVECPFKQYGCPAEVAKKTVDEHVKGCGYVPVPCPHCAEEVARTLLESHIEKDCPNVDVLCPYGCKDRMLRNQIEAHTTICAMRPQKCQYHFIGCTFEGCESEVAMHQQSGHFDILVRHVAHVDLKQSRLKTQLEEVINESKLLKRKLNEANQKINRKDSCLARMQETIEPMKANSAKFATKTELAERRAHYEETLSVNKGQIIEVEQRVSQLEKGSGSGVGNLSAENLRELVATTQQVGVHDIRLAEMEIRFQCLETANYGGVLIWKVPDYTRRKLDAATNRVRSVVCGAL